MCIHTISTQCKSPFYILKCALSAKTYKNPQILPTLVDHFVPMKITCENLNRPKRRSKRPQIKKRTPNMEVPKVQKWRKVLHLLMGSTCQIAAVGVSPFPALGIPGLHTRRVKSRFLPSCCFVHFALLPQRAPSSNTTKKLQGYSFFFTRSSHTHTRRSSLSLTLSYTEIWRPKLFLLLLHLKS